MAQNGQYQFLRLDISNGLSHNQVNCIYKDKKGFMWFGTMSGLNKYDGYSFKVYKHDSQNPYSLSDDCIVNISEGPDQKLWVDTRNGYNIYNPITEHFEHEVSVEQKQLGLPLKVVSVLKKNRDGNFWFVYPGLGICIYNTASKQVKLIDHDVTKLLYSNNVNDIAQDGHGLMWIVYSGGFLEKFDPKTNKVIYRSDLLNSANPRSTQTYRLIADRDGDLWAYAPASGSGVYYLDPVKNTIQHFDKNSSVVKLNTNIINNIVEDDKGIIWIATDHGGINMVNKNGFKVQYLLNREDDTKSISQNSCILYMDDQGIMWLGTYKRGISYYHENIIKFPVYRHFASDHNSLSYEDVNRFAEDDAGNLWIGTNGEGLIYFNRKTGKYTQYKHNQQNQNSLSNDVVISLCIDHEKKLWIGTYFGGLDCFDGKNFIHYRHNEKDDSSISDDRIWNILEDSSNRLWIGAFAGGLNLFNRDTKTFFHYKPFQPNSVNTALVSSLFLDKDQNLWCGGYYGVDVLMKKTGKFVHYIHKPKDPNSLIMNNITCITQDSRGLMWIGTLEGLNILDTKTGKFSLLLKDNGLPDNIVINILEDNKHTMWLSTSKGICNITLSADKNNAYTYLFRNFDETDGLQGREFNSNASLKMRSGELIFGGAKGFNLFDPANISNNVNKPVLAFTDLQVFNKSLSPGENIDGHVILSKSISETDAINLKYNESAFSIEFADLNFFNPGKIKLEYKLENFDKAWLSDLKTRKATYTNLDPGNYKFKVRAVNNTGVPYGDTLNLSVKITPPFWKTGLAYLIYLLSFIGAMFYIRQRGIKKIENKFALERERQEAHRMHELDMMKIDFFTNVSHEFRTPISLILAPVEKMLKNADDKDSQRKLQLVHQNAKRLLNMINQLLDFSKISVQKLKLDLKEGDIVKSIKESCELFLDLAEKKQIKFTFKYFGNAAFVFFDSDKIERILFNLLSNALKFTPEHGSVGVELNLLSSNSGGTSVIEIIVKDSGIGIPSEKHQKIFERFFQSDMPASLINQGTGIGLSITKDFVDLMGGTIAVESTPGKGSCFTLRLPFKVTKDHHEVTMNSPEERDAERTEVPIYDKRDKSITILVVDDNHDFRNYLKDDLTHFYTVVEAANGKEGWQKALALHPNLIISDINMPEFDGIDFCKKIRLDKRTEHIPFILITAFTAEEQQLVGLGTGANDYLTKPFNFEILHFKVKNLLKHQQSVKQTYQKQIEAKPGELDIEMPDVKFMRKALAAIEKNIPNADFSVEQLSSEMNMSRVALYKKIFNLSGKTPIELIKSIRLKRAVQLLETNQYTIAEIAYQVGYNDPRYFAKAFKAEFLVLPSNYINQTRN
jgi:signal transduction histidine kinase/ligand-binding sensor domain-containing protein/CheY-like chemotaxis protein/AraC-like DNA-binding protein